MKLKIFVVFFFCALMAFIIILSWPKNWDCVLYINAKEKCNEQFESCYMWGKNLIIFENYTSYFGVYDCDFETCECEFRKVSKLKWFS